MIISKYDRPKAKGGTMSETTVSIIESRVETAVVQKAQQTAANTAMDITASATVNANGELIMTTDIATSGSLQEAQ